MRVLTGETRRSIQIYNKYIEITELIRSLQNKNKNTIFPEKKVFRTHLNNSRIINTLHSKCLE